MERNNCLYFHINPVKNEIFYVGIGKKYRPRSKAGRNSAWQNTVKKYKGYVIEIVHTDLTWEEACTLEIFYINKIGRRNLGKGSLVNRKDGGYVKECIWSEEEKLQIGNRNKGRVVSEEQRIKMSTSRLGKKLSEETKKRMRESKNGFKHSEESKAKMKLLRKGLNKGVKRSEEVRLKIVAALTGRPSTQKGVPRTEEVKRRISETLKAQRGKNNIGKPKKDPIQVIIDEQKNKKK